MLCLLVSFGTPTVKRPFHNLFGARMVWLVFVFCIFVLKKTTTTKHNDFTV